MIKSIDDFKAKCEYWFDELLSIDCTCVNDEDELKELKRIINLINCDVICETESERSIWPKIDLNGIINVLDVGGKIKKLSEVDFDE